MIVSISAERAKLERDLAVIQDWIQKYTYWWTSEHDPVKRADYQLLRELWKYLERF